jgi:hypothetical protein
LRYRKRLLVLLLAAAAFWAAIYAVARLLFFH